MNPTQGLSILRNYFRKHNRLPSYQEMASLFGFASKKSSFDLIQKLIEAGFFEKDTAGRLTPQPSFFALPVLGSIPAGQPISAEEQLLDTMAFDRYLINRPGNSYLLKVKGDSMIEAGIFSGDMVVIEKDRTPKDGDVVVACIDSEFTLKTLRHINNQPYLAPANSEYKELIPKDSLEIFGVVVSVMRKYH